MQISKETAVEIFINSTDLRIEISEDENNLWAIVIACGRGRNLKFLVNSFHFARSRGEVIKEVREILTITQKVAPIALKGCTRYPTPSGEKIDLKNHFNSQLIDQVINKLKSQKRVDVTTE